MIGGFAAITKEYLQLSTRVSNTGTKVSPAINICRIDNVNADRLTVDVFLFDTNVYLTNVPISFPSKGYGYGAYFMPNKGQLALIMTTSYGRNYVLSSSSITDNKLDQTLLEGENMLLSSSGAFLKQDSLGDHIVSSSSGNMNFNGSNMLNSEISTGKEEKTLASNIVRGFALDVNKVGDSLIKGNNIKLVNYERYFKNVQTITTYVADDILSGGNINLSIQSDILNNANNVIMEITNFLQRNTTFNDDLALAGNDKQSIKTVKDNFVNDMQTGFKLNKTACLVVQKGNVVSKEIKGISDIYELADEDFIKSPSGNDVVFKMSVLDPNTQQENSYIMIDSTGNGYIKFNKLYRETANGVFTEM